MAFRLEGSGVWVEGRAYLVWDPGVTKGARQLTYKGLQESCSGAINSKLTCLELGFRDLHKQNLKPELVG